jgi:Tol biopolymer transport system component
LNSARYCLLIVACVLAGCGGSGSTPSDTPPAPAPVFNTFANPQPVTILGYSSDTSEPFLSRDGRYLFFNTSSLPGSDVNLHWAERIDDVTFQYKGEVGGVNTASTDGVASMDRNNVFYFVSLRSYDQTRSAVYRGTFANGVVSGVELVPGVSNLVPAIINYDAEISPDGNTLYFADGLFISGAVPTAADIWVAVRNGTSFSRASNSEFIMREVNTLALEFAPAISASGLELFFNRASSPIPEIYTATRANTTDPFGTPRKIQAITGYAEGPALSADEKSLYYHGFVANKFVLFRVSRP